MNQKVQRTAEVEAIDIVGEVTAELVSVAERLPVPARLRGPPPRWRVYVRIQPIRSARDAGRAAALAACRSPRGGAAVNTFLGLLIMAAIFVLYWTPTAVAGLRHVPNIGSVVVI